MFKKFLGGGKSDKAPNAPKADPVVESATKLMPGPGPLWSIEAARTKGSQFCIVPTFNGEFTLHADVQFDVRYQDNLITVKVNELLSCSDTIVVHQEGGELNARHGIPTIYRHLGGQVWTQTITQGRCTLKHFLWEHEDDNNPTPGSNVGSEVTQITESGEPLVMTLTNGIGSIAVNPTSSGSGDEALREEAAEVLYHMFQNALLSPMVTDNFVLTYNPKYVVQKAEHGTVGISSASDVLSSGIIPVCRGVTRDEDGDVVHREPLPARIEFDAQDSAQEKDDISQTGEKSSFPIQKGRAIDPLGAHIGEGMYVSGTGEITYRISDDLSVDDGGLNVKIAGVTAGSKGLTAEVAGVEVDLAPKNPFEKVSEPKKTGGLFGTRDEDSDTNILGQKRKKKKGFFG